MRALQPDEIDAVSGGSSSGYSESALTYGRGVAMVAGLAFGPVGALAAGAAFTVGWGVGMLINAAMDD